MISMDEALALLSRHAVALDQETVAIEDALGRVLASDVRATLSKPSRAVSSMDGYAARLADVTEPGATLDVVGEVRAGVSPEMTLRPGQAVRIFTGAALPDGADHILIQETTRRDGDRITYLESDAAYRWVRDAGRDFVKGELLIAAGTTLAWPHIALAAAGNHDTVELRKMPHVCIITGGDELVRPGAGLGSHQTIDAVTPALSAWLRAQGCTVETLGPLPDNADAMLAALSGIQADLLLPVGGASVGEYDHMQAVFAALDWDAVFSKVAVRPGKPLWFSTKGDRRVLGLPGNPVSALVCARVFGTALLSGDAPTFVPAVLTHDLPSEGRREHLQRGRIVDGHVDVWADQDSSRLGALAASNVLVRRQAGAVALAKGSTVDVLTL